MKRIRFTTRVREALPRASRGAVTTRRCSIAPRSIALAMPKPGFDRARVREPPLRVDDHLHGERLHLDLVVDRRLRIEPRERGVIALHDRAHRPRRRVDARMERRERSNGRAVTRG